MNEQTFTEVAIDDTKFVEIDTLDVDMAAEAVCACGCGMCICCVNPE
jgi:predicted amidohydrolase